MCTREELECIFSEMRVGAQAALDRAQSSSTADLAALELIHQRALAGLDASEQALLELVAAFDPPASVRTFSGIAPAPSHRPQEAFPAEDISQIHLHLLTD